MKSTADGEQNLRVNSEEDVIFNGISNSKGKSIFGCVVRLFRISRFKIGFFINEWLDSQKNLDALTQLFRRYFLNSSYCFAIAFPS